MSNKKETEIMDGLGIGYNMDRIVVIVIVSHKCRQLETYHNQNALILHNIPSTLPTKVVIENGCQSYRFSNQ